MSRKFCHNCGKPAQADWKGCPHCETSFASLNEKPRIQRNIKPQQESTVMMANEGENEDDNYLDHVQHYTPKIESLAVEIERPRQTNADTFGTLATNPFVNISTDQRPIPPVQSTEETLKQFAKEAGNTPKENHIN